jgi:hypothetical protein
MRERWASRGGCLPPRMRCFFLHSHPLYACMSTKSKSEREAEAIAARNKARATVAANGQSLGLLQPTYNATSSGGGSSSSGLTQDTLRLLKATGMHHLPPPTLSQGVSHGSSGSNNGWVSVPTAGGVYYWHMGRNDTQWAPPSLAPPPRGWHMATNESGTPYFYSGLYTNQNNEEGYLVSWERPTTAPPSQT